MIKTKEKYNESMYESLSKYVVERVKDKLDEEWLTDWIKKCNTKSGMTSDCIGDRKNLINVSHIERAIFNWGKENDVDMKEVEERTSENFRWMVCFIPDTIGYITHKLLCDIVRIKYNINIDTRPL